MSDTATVAGLADLLRSWLGPDGEAPQGGELSSSARLPLARSYGDGGEEPGRYPFTRGRTEIGYRDELWVMGQYSGYGTPKETNARFRRLLEAGQSGLSVALDLPTQMGLDSDHPQAEGEVGKVGTPLDTVDDLIALLDGLPLENVRQIRTTANAIGPIFAGFVIVTLEELGVDPGSVRVMLQNDPLKEYFARGTYIFPPAAGLKLAVDVVEHVANEIPRWEPIEFCGYHVRDSGGTAVDEVGIATADGIAYLDEAVRRGLDVTPLAHRLFLFLSSGVDVLEEAAKLRAARRLWARILHERYGVPESEAAINIFVYTLGGALTAQEPLNNVVRVAYETLGAAFAGVQTIATSSYDEALGLPSPDAAHLALRTQQIAAHESGATKVVDPLGGSYYVEALTDEIEREAIRRVLEIVDAGGTVAAIESGLIARTIADSSFSYQQRVEAGEQKIVGVNVHRVEAEGVREVFKVRDELQAEQRASLAARKQARDVEAVAAAIEALHATAVAGHNTVPPIVRAARARVTLGEIVETLASVFGRYRAPSIRL
jgi:methylmalonyl-CoA mutase N-terminal domain/subunit